MQLEVHQGAVQQGWQGQGFQAQGGAGWGSKADFLHYLARTLSQTTNTPEAVLLSTSATGEPKLSSAGMEATFRALIPLGVPLTFLLCGRL